MCFLLQRLGLKEIECICLILVAWPLNIWSARWGGGSRPSTSWIKMKPWHRSGKPFPTCFSFPLVISGNEDWNRGYIFWGLEGLYIFLSYNMLVIKRMFLSTQKKDKTKMFLKEEETSLKGNPWKTDHTSLPAFPVHFHLEVCHAAVFLPFDCHCHLRFSLSSCMLVLALVGSQNDKVA